LFWRRKSTQKGSRTKALDERDGAPGSESPGTCHPRDQGIERADQRIGVLWPVGRLAMTPDAASRLI
jgi:hypothetical protein